MGGGTATRSCLVRTALAPEDQHRTHSGSTSRGCAQHKATASDAYRGSAPRDRTEQIRRGWASGAANFRHQHRRSPCFEVGEAAYYGGRAPPPPPADPALEPERQHLGHHPAATLARWDQAKLLEESSAVAVVPREQGGDAERAGESTGDDRASAKATCAPEADRAANGLPAPTPEGTPGNN